MDSQGGRAVASGDIGSGVESFTAQRMASVIEIMHRSGAPQEKAPSESPSGSTSLAFDFVSDAPSFANWRKRAEDQAFDATVMIELFGVSQVCRNRSPDPCQLEEAAENVKVHLEEGLTHGHCEGMVLAAGFNFLSRMAGRELPYTGDRHALAPSIAKLWATQLDPRVRRVSAESRTKSLADQADLIFASIEQRRVVTMGVYAGDFAHALLPISARWEGDVLVVGVYDPNHPGEERLLRIDTEDDSWTFETFVNRAGVLERVGGHGAGGIDLVPIEMRSWPMKVKLG